MSNFLLYGSGLVQRRQQCSKDYLPLCCLSAVDVRFVTWLNRIHLVHTQLFKPVTNQFCSKAVRKQFNCFFIHTLTHTPATSKGPFTLQTGLNAHSNRFVSTHKQIHSIHFRAFTLLQTHKCKVAFVT